MRPVAPSRRNEIEPVSPRDACTSRRRARRRRPRAPARPAPGRRDRLPAPAVVRYEAPLPLPASGARIPPAPRSRPRRRPVRSRTEPRQQLARRHRERGDGGLEHAPEQPARSRVRHGDARAAAIVSTTGQAVRGQHRADLRRRDGIRRVGTRRSRPRRRSWQTTSVPCTCSSHRGSPGRCVRLAAAAAGVARDRSRRIVAPRAAARLSDAYGPLLVPPPRRVDSTVGHAPARGQSGSIQPDGRRGHAATSSRASTSSSACMSSGSRARHSSGRPVTGCGNAESGGVQRLARKIAQRLAQRLAAAAGKASGRRTRGRRRSGSRRAPRCTRIWWVRPSRAAPGRACCARNRRMTR